MILKFLNEGASAYNGAGQIQGNIGGTAHMKTWDNGKTGWASGLFRIGLGHQTELAGERGRCSTPKTRRYDMP